MVKVQQMKSGVCFFTVPYKLRDAMKLAKGEEFIVEVSADGKLVYSRVAKPPEQEPAPASSLPI